MKVLFIIGILAFLLIAGCITAPVSKPPEPIPQPPENQTCHTVTEVVPVVKEECGNVTYAEQVCEVRKLTYTQKILPKVDLCISDSGCVGKSLGSCPGCSKAMTRCIMQITNTESQKSGIWSVGVNYTLGDYGFYKDPITHTIGPNETVDFDFDQIYNPGSPINSATCSFAVVLEPSAEDCIEYSRTRAECNNVTKNVSVAKEVCQ
ncbi:MAG: hypothetical protein V1861_05380 [Candidatus Micrarchaeota archaeon]